MSSRTRTLKFKQWIAAPPQDVYAAFIHATALTEWLCDVAEAVQHPGGRLYLWWSQGYYASGEFIALEPNDRIVLSWHGRNEPGITQVDVAFKAKDDGTLVNLHHENLGDSKVWDKSAREFKRGWKSALENLKSVLETGQDLRFVRRPILGLAETQTLTAESAAELDLPVKSGVRIIGLMEGLGAQQAGLMPGDVLVKLGGKKIGTSSDMIAVLKRFQAGDSIKATYYRGSEKQRLKLTLSALPLPELPQTPEALSTALQKEYQQLDQALRRCFRGVSDAEASYRPAPGEWSAKEVLAHLIASERDVLAWIAGLIDGQATTEIFHSNIPSRIAATVSAFTTPSTLLDELKRLRVEVVTSLAHLPPDLAARKGTFWRMSYTLLNLTDHTQSHCEQINAVVAAARRPGAMDLLSSSRPEDEKKSDGQLAGLDGQGSELPELEIPKE